MSFLNILRLVSLLVCVTGIGTACDSGSTPVTNDSIVTATPETAVTPEAEPTSEPTPQPTNSPNPDPTPSASPTPPPAEVDSFIYQNSAGICNALDVWNPQTTTIEFPATSANPATILYVFRVDGVFQCNPDGVTGCGEAAPNLDGTFTITKTNVSGVVCTITVRDGQFVSVQ